VTSILVTGGAGLIGMAVRTLLRERREEVVAVDMTRYGRDDPALQEIPLHETERLYALSKARDVKAIVHCGAISGPMMAKGRPLDIVETNIGGTAAMLELARALAVRRFIFCSSISVYGNAGNATLDERRAPQPGSVYAATKVAGEALVQAYATEYGIDGAACGSDAYTARIAGPTAS
jgi:UDP-glucose 4-epimerase